jgi:hypothetical protein
LYRRLGGLQGWSGREQKISPPNLNIIWFKFGVTNVFVTAILVLFDSDMSHIEDFFYVRYKKLVPHMDLKSVGSTVSIWVKVNLSLPMT